MTRYAEVSARLLARSRGQAVITRSCYSISEDPRDAMGIAPIRVVSEERIQAVAFGPLDRHPQISVSVNPLGREASFLEPLAAELDQLVTQSLQNDRLPRIWLPHAAALEAVALLGPRYRANPNASDIVRRLGVICDAFADEIDFAGQQSVAVAGLLLTQHVLTGQSPAEDAHLRSLLVWLSPPRGVDILDAAQTASMQPAASMLTREEDDAVEALRAKFKKGGRSGESAQREIETILKNAALREWELLTSARHAFWTLGLPNVPGLDRLENESVKRLKPFILQSFNRPTTPHALSRALDDRQYATDLAEEVDIRRDLTARESLKRKGRVIDGEIVDIRQPRPKFKPCEITIEATQPVLRVRNNMQLTSMDGSFSGQVIRLDEPIGDRTRITLAINNGVRSIPAVNSLISVTDAEATDLRMRRSKVFAALKDAHPPLLYGDVLPPSKPRTVTGSLHIRGSK